MKQNTHLIRRWAIYILLGILACLFLTPILLMIIGSFKPDAKILAEAASLKAWVPDSLDMQNYHDVFSRVPFGGYMLNSLFITGMIVAAGLVVNSLAGYAFARLHWRWRNALFGLVLAVMVIPLEAIAVPLFYQVTLWGWRDTYWVQIVPFIANAFSIFLFYTFFIDLPRALEEAARIDGAGPLRTFITIIVPNSLPVFATVAILSFLTQWGAFLWPMMVTISEDVRPLPLGLASFYTLPPLQWGDIFAFGTLMVMPVLVVFILFQRWFVKGVAATGLKA